MFWDYECEPCEHTEERNVIEEEKNMQLCPHCNENMKRLLAAPALHTIAEGSEAHQVRMRKRSYEHTMRNARQGHSLKTNETNRNTCPSWYSKTRPRNKRKGVVQENLNLYKKFENKPSVEYIPATQVGSLKK